MRFGTPQAKSRMFLQVIRMFSEMPPVAQNYANVTPKQGSHNEANLRNNRNRGPTVAPRFKTAKIGESR